MYVSIVRKTRPWTQDLSYPSLGRIREMLGPITYRFSESDKSFLFFAILILVFLDENRVIFLQSDPPGNVKI